jgi:hypothetical protein
MPALEQSDYHLPEGFVQIGWWDTSHPVVVVPDRGEQVFVLNREATDRLVFLNSSASRLASCLAAYLEFESRCMEEVGEDEFFEGNFKDGALEALRDVLERTDPGCLAVGTFWAEQLQMELDIRKEYWRQFLR